jgi:orotidine-5'-phosphate decarboxylase
MVPIWIAVDGSDRDQLVRTCQEIDHASAVFGFKIGLEAWAAIGVQELLPYMGSRPVFIDMKFCDIPNTVGKAVAALQKFSPAIVNVHASGGIKMMEAAVAARGASDIFAVTALTSLGSEACQLSFGGAPDGVVVRFASMARDAGVQGIICSAQDIPAVRQHACLNGMRIITPGVRPTWADANDQERVATPAEAFIRGVDGIVIGRPVLKPPLGMTAYRALYRVYDEYQLAASLLETGAVRTGHFVLKSRRHADRYFHKDVLLHDGSRCAALALMLSRAIPRGAFHRFDCVVGPERGGAKLAVEVARLLHATSIAATKTDDGDGFVVGNVTGRNVIIVDDVATTGGSLERCADAVDKSGGVVVGKVVLINRGGVKDVSAVATIDVPSYDAADCPLCKDGVPIDTDVGHGGGRK